MKLTFYVLYFLVAIVALASPEGVPKLTVATGIAATGSTQIMPVNLNRATILIQNETGGTCIFAPTSFVSPNGLTLLNGQNYDSQEAFIKSAWWASCATPNASLIILESNW